MPADRSDTELETQFVRLARALAQGGFAGNVPATLLHVGDEQAVLLESRGQGPAAVHRVGLGARRMARAFFRHDPPLSRELEAAIDAIEDELMRLPRSADVRAALASSDEGLRGWAAVSGA